MFTRIVTKAFLGCALLLCMPAQAEQTKNHEYILSYDVYAGGMHALSATYNKKNTNGTYKASITAETNGFIGTLFPWTATYESHGNVDGTSFTPKHHKSTSTWKKDQKIKDIYFQDGAITKVAVTEHKKTIENKKLKPDLTTDAVDLLSATLSAFEKLNVQDDCKAETIAFDGKRKFKIKLSGGEKVTMQKSRYSTFSGDALKCTLTVEPIAGFKEKDQKRGWMAVQNHTKEHGKAPAIWLAKLEDNGPMVPVRMQIASSYGAAIAHLSNISIPSLQLIEAAAGDMTEE